MKRIITAIIFMILFAGKFLQAQEAYKALNAQVRTALDNKDYKTAIILSTAAIKLERNPESFYLRAESYSSMNDHRAALNDCDSALSYFTMHSLSFSGKGVVYFLRG